MQIEAIIQKGGLFIPNISTPYKEGAHITIDITIPSKPDSKDNILDQAAGILSDDQVDGIAFEDQIRGEWDKS